MDIFAISIGRTPALRATDGVCPRVNHHIGRDTDIFPDETAAIQNNLDVCGERRSLPNVQALVPILSGSAYLKSPKHRDLWSNVKARQPIKHCPDPRQSPCREYRSKDARDPTMRPNITGSDFRPDGGCERCWSHSGNTCNFRSTRRLLITGEKLRFRCEQFKCHRLDLRWAANRRRQRIQHQGINRFLNRALDRRLGP